MTDSYETMIGVSMYARWDPTKNRRETWEETVKRYMTFARTRMQNAAVTNHASYPEDLLNSIEQSILNKEVMPSMRAMMSAGEALDQHNAAGYNCAYLEVSEKRAFSEALYLLMCGCGVGFSVEERCISNLPKIPKLKLDAETIIVEDSREGWATGLDTLINMLYDGKLPRWDLSNIRPKGAPLLTFGGRASGPEPLDKLFRHVVRTFTRSQQKRLKPIDCHDMMCMVADCVIAGGIRRCIAGDMLVTISSNDDPVCIDELNVGDKVFTPNGWKEVTGKLDQGEQIIIDIVTQQGDEIKVSEGHKLAVFDPSSQDCKSWKEARNLSLSDMLLTFDSTCDIWNTDTRPELTPKVIQDIQRLDVPEHTYDIEVADGGEFFCMTILVHNSAMISLSDRADTDMGSAKMGSWWINFQHRAFANNSIAYDSKPSVGEFMEDWKKLFDSRSGERGIFNRMATISKMEREGRRKVIDPETGEYYVFGSNPCGEVTLRHKQFCNLTEAVLRHDDTIDSIAEKLRKATILGTLQATLTDFKYLSPEWKMNCEEERLLGVSLTGIMDCPLMNHVDSPVTLWALRDVVHDTNAYWAQFFNINRAAAATCIKPSGCLSGGARVLTTIGEIPIQDLFCDHPESGDINANDSWADYKGNVQIIFNGQAKTIQKTYRCKPSVQYRISLEGRKPFVCSGSHRFYAPDNVINCICSGDCRYDHHWHHASDLYHINEKGAKYPQLLGGNGEDSVNIIDIELIPREDIEPLFDLQVEGHTYITEGVISHNTVSQLVDSASGIHPRFAQHYIRRIRKSLVDPVCKLLMQSGVPYEPAHSNPESEMVFTFVKKAPKDAILRSTMTALDHLTLIQHYQMHYCDHRVSSTVNIREDEWPDVQAHVWRNFDRLTGVAFLPYDDSIYRQPPYEEITEEQYNELMKTIPKTIDWTKLSAIEINDRTTSAREFACTGDACEYK